MSGLPTPQKTWNIVTLANTLLSSDVNNQRDMIVKIKNQRKLFGHVVKGSGNGTVGAMDGVDRWTTYTDIPGGSSGVWFVFQQPGSGAQDMVAYGNFGESDWTFSHSPDGGFTGGSATTRPTAPHATTLYANSWFGRGEGGSNPQFVTHLFCSSDLTCFRQSFWFNGLCIGNLLYDAVDDPSVGWAAPNYGVADKTSTAITFNSSADCNRWSTEYAGGGTGIFTSAWGPSGQMQMIGSIECSGQSNVSGRLQPMSTAVTQANAITGKYDVYDPARLLRVQGYSDQGRHGRMFDLWWVPRKPWTGGSTAPLAGTKTHVIIGDQLWPWNGTTFRTT